MGPQHSLQDRRGYTTETTYDPASGSFTERAFHGLPAETPAHPASGRIGFALAAIVDRIRAAHADHLGYPYNLTGLASAPAALNDYLINNLGDPYAGSHYGSEVCDLEREVVDWLMNLWECPNPADYWGSVGASGTEGNIWALYLGREALPEAVLVHSADAHYSIPKAARILRIKAVSVASTADGAIDLDELSATLSKLDRTNGVILALTCGTTVKGAHDDIGGALARLNAAGFGEEQRFVHVDGALNAMVLPFLQDVPLGLRPTFRHRIDSMSTSGHKMIGCPMPCGVLIARRIHVTRVASAVAYLRSDDTTLMGSRNGHAVLALWKQLIGHGAAGFRKDAGRCLRMAEQLAASLRKIGAPILHNRHSLTVLFPEPDEAIVRKFQLSCTGGWAHAIAMPNVTKEQMQRFIEAYADWWKTGEKERAPDLMVA